MDVIYSSEQFCVLSYPSQQGFELFDKTACSSVYLDGAMAWHFRRSMEQIPAVSRDVEHVDAFLDEYCRGVCHPIAFH